MRIQLQLQSSTNLGERCAWRHVTHSIDALRMAVSTIPALHCVIIHLQNSNRINFPSNTYVTRNPTESNEYTSTSFSDTLYHSHHFIWKFRLNEQQRVLDSSCRWMWMWLINSHKCYSLEENWKLPARMMLNILNRRMNECHPVGMRRAFGSVGNSWGTCLA